jgi:transcriptional regulator with XRE-family HTH domain
MAKDICAATGERIRKLRRAKNWRQIDLAEHSGVHEVHISDLERGTREAGLRTLSKITSALGTTLSDLLKGL